MIYLKSNVLAYKLFLLNLIPKMNVIFKCSFALIRDCGAISNVKSVLEWSVTGFQGKHLNLIYG